MTKRKPRKPRPKPNPYKAPAKPVAVWPPKLRIPAGALVRFTGVFGNSFSDE